jgi:hypothetical protein
MEHCYKEKLTKSKQGKDDYKDFMEPRKATIKVQTKGFNMQTNFFIHPWQCNKFRKKKQCVNITGQ